MGENNIYEPIDDYDMKYRTLHEENTSKFFEDLVVQSGVDEIENVKTIETIAKYENEINNTDNKIDKYKVYRKVVIFFIVLILLLEIIFVYKVVNENFVTGTLLLDVLLIAGLLFIWIGFILILTKNINKILNSSNEYLKELRGHLDKQIELSWSQMKSLNSLYDWGMSAELVEKTLPLIKMDPYFNPKRYDILHNKYGLIDNGDINNSILFAQSGEIIGNPFLLGKRLHHYMGSETYYGYLDINWIEYVHNSDGTVTEVHKSQRLSASITRPCPMYYTNSFLIYGNEAAPNLSFSRKAGNIDELSDKKIDKKIEKGSKIIQKQVRKEVKKGGDFTAMTDSEFDVLFNALDRDHEVQFRLLFTPLAQRQMVKVLRDRTIGFGDDFDFIKSETLNMVFPQHLNKIDINTTPNRYVTNNIRKSREIFNTYNNAYFKSVYFAFAPLLSIPLYQQHKPHEYIYKDFYDSNVSCWEHESIANDFDINDLMHKNSNTPNILKTKLISSINDIDEIAVTAYGYKGVQEVEYVNVRANDGYTYQVPVEWTHYYPVDKTTRVAVKVADSIDRKKYIDKMYGDNQLKNFFSNKAGSTNRAMYRRKLIAYISNTSVTIDDSSKLNNILKGNTNN